LHARAPLVTITSGWGIYDGDLIIRGFYFSSLLRRGDSRSKVADSLRGNL
jgi:hypothetical protein